MGNCCAADSDNKQEEQNVNYSSNRAPVDNFSADLVEKNSSRGALNEQGPNSYE